MEFRYDFNLTNTLLSIHDASSNHVYVTRSPDLMNVFSTVVSFDNEAAIDDSIHTFLTAYRVHMIRIKHP